MHISFHVNTGAHTGRTHILLGVNPIHDQVDIFFRRINVGAGNQKGIIEIDFFNYLGIFSHLDHNVVSNLATARAAVRVRTPRTLLGGQPGGGPYVPHPPAFNPHINQLLINIKQFFLDEICTIDDILFRLFNLGCASQSSAALVGGDPRPPNHTPLDKNAVDTILYSLGIIPNSSCCSLGASFFAGAAAMSGVRSFASLKEIILPSSIGMNLAFTSPLPPLEMYLW
jgi:hypothetical protein